jgi:hypothetical protein
MKARVFDPAHRQSDSAQDDRANSNLRATTPDPQPPRARQCPTRDQPQGPDLPQGELTAAECEFVHAIQEYKQSSGRMFPTWSEVLEVLRSLGYRKERRDPPQSAGRSLRGSHALPPDIDRVQINGVDIDDAIPGPPASVGNPILSP